MADRAAENPIKPNSSRVIALIARNSDPKTFSRLIWFLFFQASCRAMEKTEIRPAAMASHAINRIDRDSLLEMSSRVLAIWVTSMTEILGN